MAPNNHLRTALLALGVTQLCGWAVVTLPPVIGNDVARDLGIGLPAVFAGITVMLVVMGLSAPVMSRPMIAYGARPVLAAGSLGTALGLALIAIAQGPLVYFLAWTVLGISGAGSLSLAAYVLINEMVGSASRRPIGALMLVSGLSASVFWPITNILNQGYGWRATLLIYAAGMALVCFPLHWFALPSRSHLASQAKAQTAGRPTNPEVQSRWVFPLLAAAITSYSFVSMGLSAVVIALFRETGLSNDFAIQLAASLGVVQLAARALDFFGGNRWGALAIAIFSTTVMASGIAALLLGAPAIGAVFAFLGIYGLGSGAMAVSRATLPLVFYDQAAYARAASRISFLQHPIGASSAPFLVFVLTTVSGHAALMIALGSTLISLTMLVALSLVHRRAQTP